ncbi:hypothetical protein Pd630_LPD01311 [Rhodococcus opacus PD630]|nr:hypothetical protein Pd630_LPD01311 [Rhodococcus opacus PD630]
MPGAATICTPTGRPSALNPAGTEIDGHPRTVTVNADVIQSR